jgi:sensor histidine kinase YesM
LYKYSFLLIAHIAFWLIYAAFEHISHLLYGDNHWQGSLFASIFIMVSTALLALFFKLVENKVAVLKYPLLLFMGVLLVIFWHNLTSILHAHITVDELLQAPLLDWLSGISYRILLIISWAGLFASGYTYLEKKAQEDEVVRAENTMKEAQLQQLMTQLNPHFLFNVLNSVDVAILEKETETAHQMVVKLSQLLRSTLEHKLTNKVQLEQEITLLNHFVEIEQQRFKQNIRLNYQIQPEAFLVFLPPLILQPLMENAIKFSWHLGTDCHIDLVASIKNTQLNVRISNQINANQVISNEGTKTGLENVKGRLQLLYGDEATLNTKKHANYFTAELLIPLEIAA